jgi:hypothetical protein
MDGVRNRNTQTLGMPTTKNGLSHWFYDQEQKSSRLHNDQQARRSEQASWTGLNLNHLKSNLDSVVTRYSCLFLLLEDESTAGFETNKKQT